jgi:hypothetical protein
MTYVMQLPTLGIYFAHNNKIYRATKSPEDC